VYTCTHTVASTRALILLQIHMYSYCYKYTCTHTVTSTHVLILLQVHMYSYCYKYICTQTVTSTHVLILLQVHSTNIFVSKVVVLYSRVFLFVDAATGVSVSNPQTDSITVSWTTIPDVYYMVSNITTCLHGMAMCTERLCLTHSSLLRYLS